MPSVRRLTPATTPTEPVSLELARQWVRVDGPDEDAVLLMLLKAARAKVEAYTGSFYAGGQRLALTFTLDEPYALPEGAEAEAVSGFFTSLTNLTAWSLEEYRKGISINRELGWDWAVQQTYTVTATLPDTVLVPDEVQAAILELVAEWYKNREASVNGTISVQTQVNWERKLAHLRLTPLGY